MGFHGNLYKGIEIFKDEDGYYGSHGINTDFGYCETLKEIKTEIDDYWCGAEHGEANGIFA